MFIRGHPEEVIQKGGWGVIQRGSPIDKNVQVSGVCSWPCILKKLKCFFNLSVFGIVFVRHFFRYKCLFRFLVFISVGFMVSLGSSGPKILFVLSFGGISSFIVPVASFLFISSPHIFDRSFVSMSNSRCVYGTTIIITRRQIILTGFAIVGFVFLLSARFFWSFRSIRSSRIWSVVPSHLITRCTTMAWCRTCSAARLSVKWLECVLCTRIVRPTRFPPFPVRRVNLFSATVSLVASVFPTRSTSTSFRDALVSAGLATVMTSAYVLRVLMTMLMTNLGGLGHNDGYSVRIIFTIRSNLTAVGPVRPFFLA